MTPVHFNRDQSNYLVLTAGYGISFGFIAISYVFYSRLLSPDEFGLYSIALAVGSFGTFLLDGGLRISIIIHKGEFTEKEKGSLRSGLFLVSFVLSTLIVLIEKPLTVNNPLIRNDYRFLSLFAVIYLLSYPFIVISTAFLERQLEYTRIAWIETVSVVLERASPALFLVVTSFGIYSFLFGLVLGRAFRILAVNWFHWVEWSPPSLDQFRSLLPVIREGIWIQVASAFSLLRDNLHVLLLGPFYGKAWVGYYSWGLQLCLMLSQAFVQVSARISLPMMAQSRTFDQRWRICLDQIRFLAIFTGPLLFTSLMVLPAINAKFFQGKWTPIIVLLPLLFLRMIGGLAITPVGNLVPVQNGAYIFARLAMLWTCMEAMGAVALVFFLGPRGLAYSYAFVVWMGLLVFLRSFGQGLRKPFNQVLRAIFLRPSVLGAASASLTIIAVYFYRDLPLTDALTVTAPAAVVIIVLSYLSERDVRNLILPKAV